MRVTREARCAVKVLSLRNPYPAADRGTLIAPLAARLLAIICKIERHSSIQQENPTTLPFYHSTPLSDMLQPNPSSKIRQPPTPPRDLRLDLIGML